MLTHTRLGHNHDRKESPMSSIKRLALTLVIVVIGLGGLAGVANASDNDDNYNDNGVSNVHHRSVHEHNHRKTEVIDPKGDEADDPAGGLLDTVTGLLDTVTNLVTGLL
ncbi:MAG TPA: hypothetical protein VK735_14570 [Pseudonocardia sp.]|jgi:hypothetical protein|nr:hypothetical protein [Pseudonocardia sp.]